MRAQYWVSSARPWPGSCHDGGDAPRPGLRIAEQYNVIWPLRTLGPGEATLAGVNTALSLISDNSLGFDHLNATFQRYVIREVALSV